MDSNYVQQFKKGTLEMLLLCLIARKETYGYEIINVPAKTNGGSKKYYSLTEKGKELLPELLSFWNRYTVCVDGFIENCSVPQDQKGEKTNAT